MEGVAESRRIDGGSASDLQNRTGQRMLREVEDGVAGPIDTEKGRLALLLFTVRQAFSWSSSVWVTAQLHKQLDCKLEREKGIGGCWREKTIRSGGRLVGVNTTPIRPLPDKRQTRPTSWKSAEREIKYHTL